jgi:hypothetical protein
MGRLTRRSQLKKTGRCTHRVWISPHKRRSRRQIIRPCADAMWTSAKSPMYSPNPDPHRQVGQRLQIHPTWAESPWRSRTASRCSLRKIPCRNRPARPLRQVFAMGYVPAKLIDSSNPAATANNVAAPKTVFPPGISPRTSSQHRSRAHRHARRTNPAQSEWERKRRSASHQPFVRRSAVDRAGGPASRNDRKTAKRPRPTAAPPTDPRRKWITLPPTCGSPTHTQRQAGGHDPDDDSRPR